MSMSNYIAGMIVIAFLVFITTKGELTNYMNLIRGETSSGATPIQPQPPKQSDNSSSSGSNNLGGMVAMAGTVAAFM